MNTGVLADLAKTFALISIISVGGATATVPEIHRQIVDTMHWMDGPTFANLLAVAQVAPGPNVLIVGMIGWHVAGIMGLAVAMAAMLIPSCALAFAANRAMEHFASVRWVAVARQALGPVAVGLILASGLILSQAADRGVLTFAITGGMTLFVILTRANPLFGILAGAVLGFLGGHLGFFP